MRGERALQGGLVGVAAATLLVGTVGLGASTATAKTPPPPSCAYGTSVPGLDGYEQSAVEADASAYANGLSGASAAERKSAAQIFAAAAAAYIYGVAPVDVRNTVKGFIARNQITSVDALQTPAGKTVVSPNVDTTYTVGWIDLTAGPVVVSVPDTGGRFFTVQMMDAASNSFAYLGSGSTGTHAGSYALVPPGWSGTLPAGVTAIQSPTNTVWLLGRVQVDGSADLAKVKPILEHITASPLPAYELGDKGSALVLSSYPPSPKPAVPTGTNFIETLNQDLQVDPPPSSDTCALAAFAPAGVAEPTRSAAAELAADYGPTPLWSGSAAQTAAVDAGTAAAPQIIAGASTTLSDTSAAANNGWDMLGNWVGNYGGRYLGRGMIATDLLAANIPRIEVYPTANQDSNGAALNGATHAYQITFPAGELPPVGAFWSLTMYGPDDYLYANQIDRYAVGDRTGNLVYNKDGSLTLYIQHDQPASTAEQANWLPAPAGAFHLILRMYLPEPQVLDGSWKVPPVVAAG